MKIYVKNIEKFIDFQNKNEINAFEIACEIDIKNKAIAAIVNGKEVDLSEKIYADSEVEIIIKNSEKGLQILRHSTAHVLAMALSELDPTIQLAIGPSVENGFYYDIKSTKNFSIDDFEFIENKIREIIKRKLPFKKKIFSKTDAIEYFSKNKQNYKVELIKDIPEDSVSIYYIGENFMDLCKGPHIPNTSYIPEDAIKLTAVAGAYWRGDSKKDMLQRLYGTAFFSKKDMNLYFELLHEAQSRDHRKLGPELDIFHIDESAPGNIFWLKNGTILFSLIRDYLTKVIKKHGYHLVQTPQLLNRSLWETSGHWEKFKENMFIVNDAETTMAIKPMNCPGHIICYQCGAVKSYRDLPIRMAEFGLCHRNESSGSLHGVMRLRAFVQDDGHVFCAPDQIIAETINICHALKEIYSHFGFNEIAVKFSDRPAKRAGSDEVWDLAEKSLMDAADAAGLSYTINKGEGAFYGPKLEFVLKDSLGRDWQCGTLQVDFVLPDRFGISYIDKDGSKKTPVMIHRALVGSLERFIGILIENYAGKFPFWLAPIQIAVASITEETAEYANQIAKELEEQDFRVILDIENEKINYKIREHSLKKIPVILIIGKKERDENLISIRQLGSEKTETIKRSEMSKYFEEILNK